LSSTVSKTDSAFLNHSNNYCLSKMDSFLPEGLARARIFCRCYSLVLNVETLGYLETVATAIRDEVFDARFLLFLWHRGLSCCMFLQIGAFSNFRRDTGGATFACRSRALLNPPKKKDTNIHNCVVSKHKVRTYIEDFHSASFFYNFQTWPLLNSMGNNRAA